MINYGEALLLIEKNNLPIQNEYISIQKALNRVCVEKIQAPFSVPRFHNSAMDGFALKYEQTLGCSPKNLKQFKVIESIAAGDKIDNYDSSNEPFVVEIMTGAQVPDFFNCVIPVEDINIISNSKNFIIEINKELKMGEYIRYKGEDVLEGQIIIFENEQITHEKIMLLSSFGIDKILVKNKLKVAILSTGKELVDDISEKLNDQQIFNSNTPYLNSILNEYPVEAKIFKTLSDDKKLFLNAIQDIKQQGFHFIISTGAVSKGKWDIIPECLKQLGAKIIFHRVNIKPGKPILFAQIEESLFYFGLPGNPVSTAVGFRFFISPFIRNILGLKKETMKKLKLLNEGKKKIGMTLFLKGSILFDDNAIVRGEILEGQESFKIKSLTESNGWIILPENMEDYKENDFAYFLPLEIDSKVFV